MHADYYIEEESVSVTLSGRNFTIRQSLTGLEDLCRVKSDLLPSAVSSEGDARNNQPAGNVFHVPDALTVIVYLLMPFGRMIEDAAFRARQEQRLPGSREAMPRSVS